MYKRQDNDYLTIKIEDNGPGIPEDERDRIFERFYRLDDSRARDTGEMCIRDRLIAHNDFTTA